MDFIFGPTLCHGLKYCEIHDLNPKKFTFLDLNNPWYIIEWRLEQRNFEGKTGILVLDNDYRHNPELFQQIMGYIEEYDDEFRMEIVEGVHFHRSRA